LEKPEAARVGARPCIHRLRWDERGVRTEQLRLALGTQRRDSGACERGEEQGAQAVFVTVHRLVKETRAEVEPAHERRLLRQLSVEARPDRARKEVRLRPVTVVQAGGEDARPGGG